MGLPDGEEIMPRFDTIPARDRQTDRRTDTLLSQRPALAERRAGKIYVTELAE